VETAAQILTVLCNGLANLLFSLLCGLTCALLWGKWSPEIVQQLRVKFGVLGGSLSILFVVQLWLLACTMLGTANPRTVFPQLTDVLLNTHAGRIIVPQFGVSILIVATLFVPKRIHIALITALVLLLSVWKAASGHASTDGNFSSRELCQWIHLLSTSVWSGGVIAASVYAFRANTSELTQPIAERLSRQSTIAVLFVLISGGANTLFGTEGAIPTIASSAWGHILIVKLTFVAAALILGAANRRLIQKSERFPNHVLKMEAIIMVLILFISGWLAASPPANQ
jgi:copper resistance protein D